MKRPLSPLRIRTPEFLKLSCAGVSLMDTGAQLIWYDMDALEDVQLNGQTDDTHDIGCDCAVVFCVLSWWNHKVVNVVNSQNEKSKPSIMHAVLGAGRMEWEKQERPESFLMVCS